MNPGNLKSVEMRAARSRLKAQVNAGHRPVALVLIHPPEEATRMQVGELLKAARGIHRTKLNRICRSADVLPTELLCELPIEKRRRLVLALPPRVAGRERALRPDTVSVQTENGAAPLTRPAPRPREQRPLTEKKPTQAASASAQRGGR